MEIDTAFGPANLHFEHASDPNNPGWVLRYHLAPPGDEALGRRNLDEILTSDDPDDPDEAEREARAFLTRNGIQVLDA